MVHVTTPRPSLGAALGNALGTVGAQEYGRHQTRKGLENLRNAPQGSPIEQLYNLIEASTYSPAIGKSLGPLYQTLMEQRNKENIGKVPLTGGGLSASGRAQMPQNPQMNQPEPMQAGQLSAQGRPPSSDVEKFYPTTVGPNEAPGNFPQEATGGIVKPVWTGEELLQQGQNLYNMWREVGITDKSLGDAIAMKQIEQQENIAHNARVEEERTRRVTEQENYGALGEEYLKNIYPEATDEMKAIARKNGEDLAGQGKSQGEIRRTLANQARDLKNTISNIENTLNAPRIQNKLQRKLSGKERSLEQAENDAREMIKPLIKEGLYDTSKALLSKSGFYPEERERIIFGPVKPEVRKTIRDIPKPIYEKNEPVQKVPGMPFPGVSGESRVYSPESLDNLKQNIMDVWGPNKVNEDFNLIQNRKEYEDKDYDWIIYKDSLNDLLKEGKIEFTGDQANQFNSYLAEPPLSFLEKILYKFNLIGR